MIWCGRTILHGIICYGVCYRKVYGICYGVVCLYCIVCYDICYGVCYRKVWYMIWCGKNILHGIVYYGV